MKTKQLTFRRSLIYLLLMTLLLPCPSCRPEPDVVDWLASRRRHDGLWATDTYGVLARGESTTAGIST